MGERVIVQGSEAVDRYLDEYKLFGFDIVEVSSGLAPIHLKDKVEIVRHIKKIGMKPKPEISMMIGAGAGYEEELTKLRPLEEVNMHKQAGAEIMMIESEGITEDLPPEKWRIDVIKKLDENFGFGRFMFEASDPPVFKWYLKNFGSNVNLFIDHSQIVEFTAWKDKPIRYHYH